MALWLARAGKHGEDQKRALDKGRVFLESQELGDLSDLTGREDLVSRLRTTYLGAPEGRMFVRRAREYEYLKGGYWSPGWVQAQGGPRESQALLRPASLGCR